MNLNTITEIKRPKSHDEIRHWQDGFAWLAGGTWLFSEPQIQTNTLIDLESLGWSALTCDAAGLEELQHVADLAEKRMPCAGPEL